MKDKNVEEITKEITLEKKVTFSYFWAIFWAIVCACFLVFPFIFVLAFPVLSYCLNPGRDMSEWCYNQIPNIYNYIQDVHWDVGFLRSFKLSRTYFIVWGMQTIIILFIGLKNYLASNWKSFFTLNIIKPRN